MLHVTRRSNVVKVVVTGFIARPFVSLDIIFVKLSWNKKKRVTVCKENSTPGPNKSHRKS